MSERELRIDLIGDDTAVFPGGALHHPNPVRAYCRRLVRRDHPPELALAVYRNGKLERRISIGEGAALPLFEALRDDAQAAGSASSVSEAPASIGAATTVVAKWRAA